MQRYQVWDPLVRVFHWSVVICVLLNAVILDAESRLHRQIGYVVMGLLAVRILWGFIGTRHARFADFPPSPSASVEQVRDMLAGRRVAHPGHSALGALMIYNLLLSLVGIVATGWMMTTNQWFGIDWVEQAHEAIVTWLEISVVAHVAAVVVESRRLRVNLPKSMVTGYKDIPR